MSVKPHLVNPTLQMLWQRMKSGKLSF